MFANQCIQNERGLCIVSDSPLTRPIIHFSELLSWYSLLFASHRCVLRKPAAVSFRYQHCKPIAGWFSFWQWFSPHLPGWKLITEVSTRLSGGEDLVWNSALLFEQHKWRHLYKLSFHQNQFNYLFCLQIINFKNVLYETEKSWIWILTLKLGSMGLEHLKDNV